jgi:hypothetical protein
VRDGLIRPQYNEMTDITPLRAITIDCAFAPEGGSLFLQISVDGQTWDYVLNRSIASRGTACYEEISGKHGPLSKDELRDLLVALDHPQDGTCADVAYEFVRVLKRANLG